MTSPLISLSGSGPALLSDTGELSHDELAQAAAQRARSWGPQRRLVLLEFGNDIESVINYLAALNHGHVVLVVPPDRPAQRQAIAEAYDPDIVCLVSRAVAVRRSASAHVLHPDLALLLSTSGSSGSPKLVRLSRDNVMSNARAIADYQLLGPDDRAITSLPLHYCFGLSVLHSHLLVGAAVVLTDLSVVDSCFWSLARAAEVTTVSGVPHTFDLLARAGEPQRGLTSLRRLAQAGGRLDPDRVRALAAQGESAGFEFFVMYGQTEATARMAYLPPHLARTHPEAVGVAIPGGAFSLRAAPEVENPEIGELIYAGPGVMMGYAQTPDDLARASGPQVLATGDLACVRNGLVHIVGRRARRAKLFGLRVDLDHLESALLASGFTTRCIATERRLHVFVSSDRAPGLRRLAARTCGIPEVSVHVHERVSTPLTDSGKVDHGALQAMAESWEHDHDGNSDPAAPTPQPDAVEQVQAAFALVLGRDDVRACDNFGSLGGDSLSYIELATRLEQIMPGRLPQEWHRLPIQTLAATLSASVAASVSASVAPDRPGSRQRSQGLVRLDTSTVLRAVAIVLIVASHADVLAIMGGAHLLLALAGYNFARFQLADADRAVRVRNIAVTGVSIAVPCSVWISAVALLDGRYGWPTAVYVHQIVGTDTWSAGWEFWFIDALLLALLTAAAALSSARINRFEAARPWAFALLACVLCLGARVLWVGWTAGPTERYRAPVVLMFFALGWLVARSPHGVRRWAAAVLVAAMTLGFFGDLQRELVIITGLALVLWWPAMLVPRALAPAITLVATASLGIYLTHWLVYPPLEAAGLGVVAVLASLAVGVAFTAVTSPVRRGLPRAVRRWVYSTGSPSPRAINMRCTSEVPSPISSTLASR